MSYRRFGLLVPRLHRHGVTDDHVRVLLIDNPRQVLAVEA